MGMPDVLGNIFTMVQYQNWKKENNFPRKILLRVATWTKFSRIFYPELFFFLRKNDPVNLLLLASWGFLLPRDSKNRTTIGILSPGSRSTTSAIANRRHQLRRTSLLRWTKPFLPQMDWIFVLGEASRQFLGEAQRIGENKYTQKSDSR